ncbi:MAG TPA: hypothetical protein VLF14_04480 [Candidatus Binatia bacterium]|nr:hypothetical protein [Candidatus Binatia bacterium]
MGRTLVILGIAACVIFGWHVNGVADARRHAEELRRKYSIGPYDDAITVNPVTDVVTVPVGSWREKPKSDNPFEALGSALGSMLGGALGKALEPSFERELNLRAREDYDVYAMLLPYRVRLVSAAEEEKEKPTPTP